MTPVVFFDFTGKAFLLQSWSDVADKGGLNLVARVGQAQRLRDDKVVCLSQGASRIVLYACSDDEVREGFRALGRQLAQVQQAKEQMQYEFDLNHE